MARSKAPVSGALRIAWLLGGRVPTDANEAVSARAFGSVLEDHFHPGASAGSSRRESMRSVERALSDSVLGRSKRVMENPGMLRLVCSDISHPCHGGRRTNHERSGQNAKGLDALLVKRALCLADDGAELELAKTAEVVYEQHDAVGTVVLKRHKRSVRISSRCDHLDEVWDEFVERGNWRDAVMAAFVVDTKPNLEFIGPKVSVRYRSARHLRITTQMARTCC